MPKLPGIPNPRSYLEYVVHHPLQIIAIVALMTFLFAWQIPKLQFQTSIYDLTIEDLPETGRYEQFKKQFGSEEIILVVAKAEDVFDPKTFQQIERLAQTLSEIEGIKQVISLPGIKKAMDVTKRWDLADFRKIISPIGLLQRNIISDDGKTTVISLILEDIEEKDQVVVDVEEVINRHTAPLSLYQIGMPIVSKALAEFTRLDFLMLPPVTFCLVVLILLLLLRSLRGILIPACSVLIALTWTFGFMALTGTPLSMITMIVPVFLIAVGTAYCMYIFPEYSSSIKESETPREASIKCFLQLGFPTSLAVITTSIGLCSLLLNKITAIREFALFSCFGILSTLVILLTFVPALMALLPFPKEKAEHVSAKANLLDRLLSGIIKVNLRHQKIALSLLGLIALAGIIGIFQIRVETNPVDFFKRDTAVSQHFHDIYRDMAGSFPMNVVIDSRQENYFEDPARLTQIAKLQGFLESLDGVDKTISFPDYIKLINYATNQYREEYYILPERSYKLRMLTNSFKTMLGHEVLDRFLNAEFSRMNILLRTHISSSADFLATRKQIEAYLHAKFPKDLAFQVTGFGIVISQSSRLLTEGQVKSLSLTLILIFVIMLFLFLSYKVGLIAMVPNCFPIITSFGCMGWLGIPLSVATSLVASVAIGLAVDDTIHYLVRYNREFNKDLDKTRALQDTVRSVGKPIVFTTVTITLGFSVLMGSNFSPTSVFGLMMVITMLSALVGDLILLPSLILHVELVTLWDLVRLKLGKDPQKGISIFDGLSRRQVHYILMVGALKTYDRGEAVMRKGEMSDSMYAIISGELHVVNVPGDPKQEINSSAVQHIRTLKPGDVVGEMGMIRATKRSATVIAAQPSELLQINDRMIKRLHWLYPPTAQKFFFNLMGIVCDRLDSLTESYLKSSVFDSLSGLLNREFFLSTLENEVARSRRYKTPLSLFFVELENLKEINDRYGYQTGDLIIRETGNLLSEHLRSSDLLCRYGGNLFAAMVPHSSSDATRSLCERFKELLTRHSFQTGSNPLSVRAFFGLASLNAGTKSGEELLKNALEAVRRAKDAAQNRVGEFE